MCAFAGGELVQHVEGHDMGRHQVVTHKGEVVEVTSSHHQMLYPFEVKHEMLAWCDNSLSKDYCGETDEDQYNFDNKVEPEIVYFPEIRGIAIQGHPEWAVGSRFADLCVELIDAYLFKE